MVIHAAKPDCSHDKGPPGSIEGEAPMQVPQTVRAVIDKGPFAHLTTLNPNGSPQVTVVWVGIDGEEFVMGHLAMHQKVRNIRRDPRVALSLLGYNTTQGMREYVVIYGDARVTEGGAVPLLQRLAPIYLGPGAEYPPASMRNIAGYVTRIVPARFSGVGPGFNKPLADHEPLDTGTYPLLRDDSHRRNSVPP
jgi:PPOX class probable F420-dependent enzyme